jgi:hypothetical protein
MTTARCARDRSIVSSTASSVADSGTTGIGRRSLAAMAFRQQPPQQVLHVQHADDVVEVAFID